MLKNILKVLPHVRNPVSALNILASSLTPTGGLSLSFHSKFVDSHWVLSSQLCTSAMFFFGQPMIIKMNHWRHGRAGIYQMKHLMRLVNEVAISMEEKVMMVKLISFFLSVQWELRFRSGTLEWSWRSCLGPTGTRGPRSTSWRLMGSSGKLDLVTITDVIVIIILLWSIESDMAVVPTPLLELIQRARSCSSSSTRATKALISHRWERGKLFLWTLLWGFKQV